MSVVMLALLTILFLALFSLSRTEMRSAVVYADQVEARSLAETATNLVIGQIRDATGVLGETWASQPGAIRRWDQQGEFVAGHKLYSDSDMIINRSNGGSEQLLSADFPDPNWETFPARYVDLNEPVERVGAGLISVHYPIVDPRAAFPVTGGSYQDPGAIEGFGYDSAFPGVIPAADLTARLPMPVEWIYVLKDGTVGHLDVSNVFVPAGKVTAENPIIGRIAFWADDETSKININTASEPTFWDVPRVTGGDISGTEPQSGDVWYAKYQPGKNEWQRYPGHPATTALSPVLFPGTLTPANKETIYSMVPRIIGGGSQSGTFWDPTLAIFSINPTSDQDRLYASVDEFLLKPDRSEQQPSLLDRSRLERSRFFLTASSRASELNLFGFPKVCMWPIDSEERAKSSNVGDYWLSPSDKVFEFVSTMGWNDSNSNGLIDSGEQRNPYIFQRVNPRTIDSEWDEPRNGELWDYLAALTSDNFDVPGYGGNFEEKYNEATSNFSGRTGNDRDNLITASFDYIRTINGLDPARDLENPKKVDFVDGFGQLHPLTKSVGVAEETRGFGRYYGISSVGLAFIATVDPHFWPESNQANHPGFTDIKDYTSLPLVDHDGVAATPEIRQLPDDRIALSAAMIVDSAVVAHGWRRSGGGRIGAVVEGLKGLQIWGYESATDTVEKWVDLFPYDMQRIDVGDGGGYHSRYWGGHVGVRPWLERGSGPQDPSTPNRGKLRGNVVMIKVPADPRNARIRFRGGTVTAEVFHATNGYSFNRLGPFHLNSYTFEWPSHETPGFPRPYLAQASPDSNWDNGDGNYVTPQGWWHWDSRISQINKIPSYPWGAPPDWMRPLGTPMSGVGFVPTGPIGRQGNSPSSHTNWWGANTTTNNYAASPSGGNIDGVYTPLQGGLLRYGDVVRSLVITDPSGSSDGAFTPGDLRMAFGHRDVPAELYQPHDAYFSDSAEDRIDHLLWHSAAGPHYMLGYSNSVSTDSYQIPTVASQEIPTQLTDAHYHFSKTPYYPRGIVTDGSVVLSDHVTTGDFDNGVALTPDGAYINKADDGNAKRSNKAGQNAFDRDIPYLTVSWASTEAEEALFSPNRQVPSPVMLGSLPTGVKRGRPWETLLFRPQPPIGGVYDGHPNHPDHSDTNAGGEIPDHLWLDLFWMPVVEPYAISEPHSTAGKINLNTQILPFSYIERKTGLHGVMKAEEMLCVPDELAADYKNWDHSGPDYDIPPPATGLRRKIHLDETLKQWDVKHTEEGELFRSPGEICDIHLVPDMTDGPARGYLAGVSPWSAQPIALTNDGNSKVDQEMHQFWEAHSPTGDNSRERPYAHLYPRLTTKSNTYRVHMRAQVFRQLPDVPTGEIDPTKLTTVSEYRGSTVIERFIDPKEPGVPDYATVVPTQSSLLGGKNLDSFYRFRVVHSKRFEP